MQGRGPYQTSQQTQHIEHVLVQCLGNVADVGPTLNQQRFVCVVLLGTSAKAEGRIPSPVISVHQDVVHLISTTHNLTRVTLAAYNVTQAISASNRA